MFLLGLFAVVIPVLYWAYRSVLIFINMGISLFTISFFSGIVLVFIGTVLVAFYGNNINNDDIKGGY